MITVWQKQDKLCSGDKSQFEVKKSIYEKGAEK